MSNKIVLYCPICGSKLCSGNGTLYQCNNIICNYKLDNPNTIDISFKSKDIAKALSNLCPYPFIFDNVQCSSMEAFIQSLKIKDSVMQVDICTKTGLFCYSIRGMFEDWRTRQTLYWKGKPICRHSIEYINLLKDAYKAMLLQSPTFYYALKKVKEQKYSLIHSIGCKDPSETLLTPKEFTQILYYLINNYVD